MKLNKCVFSHGLVKSQVKGNTKLSEGPDPKNVEVNNHLAAILITLSWEYDPLNTMGLTFK